MPQFLKDGLTFDEVWRLINTLMGVLLFAMQVSRLHYQMKDQLFAPNPMRKSLGIWTFCQALYIASITEYGVEALIDDTPVGWRTGVVTVSLLLGLVAMQTVVRNERDVMTMWTNSILRRRKGDPPNA